uniref:Glutamyl/glutaminyl-tRNA synthetase class Ib catalytic domain-containing protein n=1 Tax=Brassica oleracea var. oleracea TaxID=109376 RepID=A0A0D3BAT5_BRAOL
MLIVGACEDEGDCEVKTIASGVLRGEEHLPYTLRQALMYKALEFPMPQFAHVSLILAPDRGKTIKTTWGNLEKFSIERVNKSGAIFDSTKLLMELKCSATQSLKKKMIPVIKAQRSAMVLLAATLFSSAAVSASANASVFDEYLEKSKTNKVKP